MCKDDGYKANSVISPPNDASSKTSLKSKVLPLRRRALSQVSSLRTADVFPVVASLPPKNNVCESEQRNDFRDVKPFQPITVLALKTKELTRETSRKIVRGEYVFKSKLKG